MMMYLVRWKLDKKLLGVFNADTIDSLAYLVDEFASPPDFEYLPAGQGGFILQQANTLGENGLSRRLDGVEVDWMGEGAKQDIEVPLTPIRLSFTEMLEEKFLKAKWKQLNSSDSNAPWKVLGD